MAGTEYRVNTVTEWLKNANSEAIEGSPRRHHWALSDLYRVEGQFGIELNREYTEIAEDRLRQNELF